MEVSQPGVSERTEEEVAAKKELDAAFDAFETCNSPQNYRRLDDARYGYETVCGRLAKDLHRAQLSAA